MGCAWYRYTLLVTASDGAFGCRLVEIAACRSLDVYGRLWGDRIGLALDHCTSAELRRP